MSTPPDPALVRAARAEAHDASLQMVADGLVVGSAGNVSVRVGGAIVVSPAGVPYADLVPDDYPVVDLVTGRAAGGRPPTSEVPLHLALMRGRPELGAIVHTHSRSATAFAVARRPIPFVCNENLGPAAGEIAVSDPYAAPSTDALARAALATFDRAPGSRAILLANHGVVALGATARAAELVAAQVEWIARICLDAQLLGGPHVLTVDEQDQVAAAYGVRLARAPEAQRNSSTSR